MEPRTTSSLPLEPSQGLRSARSLRHGFTLIEVLVVMGIILLLVAILLPAINGAYKQAIRGQMMSDLNELSRALDTYKAEFGNYPRTGSSGVSGPKLMCWALVAPGPQSEDGFGQMNGSALAVPDNGAPGFRVHAIIPPAVAGTTQPAQGKVYGPYISVDRFLVGTLYDPNQYPSKVAVAPNVYPVPSGYAINSGDSEIGDRYHHVILYIPTYPNVPPAKMVVDQFNPGTTPTSYYNYKDFSGYLDSVSASQLTQKAFSYAVGDTDGDYMIGKGETLTTNSPYILWSAGPDGVFGPRLDPNTKLVNDPGDDVVYPPLTPWPVGFQP